MTLDALAAGVEWPDAGAIAAAREVAAPSSGRLAELGEWLAGTRGSFPPAPLNRPRLVLVGAEPSTIAGELAGSLDVSTRTLTLTQDPFADGVAGADDEVDSGADLLVVASEATDAHNAALPVVVSLVTTAEPVTLLPRGAAATDTAAWIDYAEQVRDTRRSVAGLRRDPVALLERLADPVLAAATGFVLQAVLRRTPLLLDGVVAAVAGLLVADLASRAARWWRVADALPDPVHRRCVDEFDHEPLLRLGVSAPAGVAGLLAVPMLTTAVALAGASSAAGEGRVS